MNAQRRDDYPASVRTAHVPADGKPSQRTKGPLYTGSPSSTKFYFGLVLIFAWIQNAHDPVEILYARKLDAYAPFSSTKGDLHVGIKAIRKS